MKEAIKKIEHLLHLHACEQEGLTSGQPKPEDWFNAVNEAQKAIETLQQLSPKEGKTENELYKEMLGAIYIKSGGRNENISAAKACVNVAIEYAQQQKQLGVNAPSVEEIVKLSENNWYTDNGFMDEEDKLKSAFQDGFKSALNSTSPAHQIKAKGLPSEEKCIWEFDSTHECYETQCGKLSTFIDGGVEENDVKYCQFCGSEIINK